MARKAYDYFRAMHTLGGECKCCKKVSGMERYILVKEEYPSPNLDPRWVLTLCRKCAGQIFGTDIPGKITRLLKADYGRRSGQYLGFDKYWIDCKMRKEEYYEGRDGTDVRPHICVACEWFGGFQGSWITGILCCYRTAEDKSREERMIKIFNLECPDCGGKLDDNTIKEDPHKGHGNISCPKCQKVHITI